MAKDDGGVCSGININFQYAYENGIDEGKETTQDILASEVSC